jgi:hypothetical protein
MNEGYDVSRQPPQLLQASPPFDQSQGGPRERRLAQPLPGMQAAAGPKREKRGMRLAAGSTNAPPSACLAHIAHLCCWAGCCWLLLAAAGCCWLLLAAPFPAICTEVPELQTKPASHSLEGFRCHSCQRRIMRQPEWLGRSTTQIQRPVRWM